MSSSFDFLYKKEISEYHSELVCYKHKKTGFEVAHLLNDDNENLFAFIFRTPVTDDTGVPHIMEHSTLCGSKRFPLKDPFVLLLKGSLNTYLNAFTSQDCTVYLAASTLPKDYYNLMTVYGDAVFNPLLRYEAFLQEGYNYQKQDAGLKIQGVVYNEMKGNYSSTESIVGDWSSRSLFPGTTYGHDTGGDPAAIPSLSFEAYKAFYESFYHPSNGKLFLYGNIPTEDQLEFLENNFLKDYTGKVIDSSISSPERFRAPVVLKKEYFYTGTDLKNKTHITYNWLTKPIGEYKDFMKLEFLHEILLGHDGAPLKKRLVTSRLGEDLSPSSGLDTNCSDAVFTVGLRGTDEDREKDVSALIENTFKEIVKDGVDPEIVEAALHRIEFRKREINSSGPFGIKLLFKVLKGWLHELRPEETLAFMDSLNNLKKEIKEETHFYKEYISKYFLENSHKSTVLVYPDPAKEEKERKVLNEKLEALAQDETFMEKVDADQALLKEFQKEPDKPEDIAKIPVLEIEDLPRKVLTVDYEKIVINGNCDLYYHDINTNGIVYIDLAFDLSRLEENDLGYLPLFGKLLMRSGLPGMSYDKVASLISLYTGGISTSLSVSTAVSGKIKKIMLVSIKMLKEKFSQAMGLLKDLLLGAPFEDKKRISDLIKESKNRYKSSIIPHGNYFASIRAGSMLNSSFQLEDVLHGIGQFQFLMDVTENTDAALPGIISKCRQIREQVFSGNRMSVNLTCGKDDFSSIKNAFFEFAREFTEGPVVIPREENLLISHGKRGFKEAIETSSLVNYVALGMPGAKYGTKESAIESVISHILRTGYLWDTIRLEGGAYGASASSYGLEKLFTFASFRDPHIISTLDAYKNAFHSLKDLTAGQLKPAIIGAVGNDIKPLRGAQKGYINFKRRLFGITDTTRQARRDVMLNLTHRELCDYAGQMSESLKDHVVSVVTSERNLQKENLAFDSIVKLSV